MKKKMLKIGWPMILLFICALMIQLERYGIFYQTKQQPRLDNITKETNLLEQDAECLVLQCSTDEISKIYEPIVDRVLSDMKVPYDKVDVQQTDIKPILSQYQTVLITVEDWSLFQDSLLELCKWVRDGGAVMNVATPVPNESFQMVAGKLGILTHSDQYVGIQGFTITEDFLLGTSVGDQFTYVSEEDMAPLYISLDVSLSADSTIYMQADQKTPLLWRTTYGKGKFVVINETLTEKYQRGILAAAYSLLKDVCIYPVINGSSFYLDDFPSPIPSGDGTYIRRDYGVDIDTFYNAIWWPDVLGWESEYGIVHTGLIIEDYNDTVQAPFARQQAVAQFTTFGNMLLKHGGELGFHGYNHMPLCIAGIDEDKQYGEYELWNSKEDVILGMQELETFSKQIFPNQQFQVYVPPSNIISEEGIEALLEACPDIRVIASTYLTDSAHIAYEQEFGVAANGIINTPRIVSGCDLDQYQMLTAISELNFHYVQSHFMHPDDVLDVDRGAKLGWHKLKEKFEQYLKWLQTEVPDIRNLSGSEMGQAVLSYDQIQMKRSMQDNLLEITLVNPQQDAYFLCRLNSGSIAQADYCEVEQLKEDLYLIHTTEDKITIKLLQE